MKNRKINYKKITELNDSEIKLIVNEICQPEKITKIRRYKREEKIIVEMKTRWHTTDDDGKDVFYLDTEEITLKDPFANDYGFGYDSNTYNFNTAEEQEKFKKFCLSKGVCRYLKDNQYMEK